MLRCLKARCDPVLFARRLRCYPEDKKQGKRQAPTMKKLTNTSGRAKGVPHRRRLGYTLLGSISSPFRNYRRLNDFPVSVAHGAV